MQFYARVILIVAWVLLAALCIKMLKIASARAWADTSIQRAYKVLARLMRLSITVEGNMAQQRPLLLVTNHISYLDIIVLGTAARVVFTPKAEIARWPVIGFICRLTECVFIDRRVSQTANNLEALRTALGKGHAVVLFPEGTTSDGKRTLPFRTSYFTLVGENIGGIPLSVQAARISYTRVHGLPIDAALMPSIAWYGDMELVPHLKQLLCLGPIATHVRFCQAIQPSAGEGRKTVAAACEEMMANN